MKTYNENILKKLYINVNILAFIMLRHTKT